LVVQIGTLKRKFIPQPGGGRGGDILKVDTEKLTHFFFSAETQATLHANGDVVFVYVNIPEMLTVDALYDDEPVAGLSDAFLVPALLYLQLQLVYKKRLPGLLGSEPGFF
jgi:hypothetical protein